jgi:uncharacterized tellurite resistance protein B-like protein
VLLPRELAQQIESGAVRDLRSVLEKALTNGPKLLAAKELLAHVNGSATGQINKAALVSCADTLSYFGIGLAPDPRTAYQLPKADQPIVLFRLPTRDGEAVDDRAYRNALLFVSFAAHIAHAGGTVSPTEREWLERFVHDAPALDEEHRVRLHANLQWLLAVPPTVSVLRSRLAPLSPEDRQELGHAALGVACANAKVDPAQIKALQQVYKLLGLDESRVFHDVHALMAGTTTVDEPVPIRIDQPAQDRYAIPQPERQIPEAGIRLDPKRVREVTENTERVSAILAKVFAGAETEDAAPVTAAPQTAPEPALDHNAFDGLDSRYGAFLAELLSRSQWPRSDLDTLARSFALMTDGALETINEWAFDRYGDALIEDGEPMTVNGPVLQRLRFPEVADA